MTELELPIELENLTIKQDEVMIKQDNALSAYCFLSALTENQNDLYNHVYLPICKRALSLYSLEGHSHGNSLNIKNVILSEYGIDIPISVIQSLIKSVEKQLSRKEKINLEFKIFENGKTFELGKYVFSELEDKYKRSSRNANAIQIAFEEYLKTEDVGLEVIPSFIEFLNKNKRRLASYFKGKPESNEDGIEGTYLPHVHFLEKISKSNHDLYKIAESLYLGSIVAGFLESGIDIEAKFTDGEVYYLDTPVILSALDLQKEEETSPILELFTLIKNSGGSLRVLSITVDEIQGIVNKAIGSYDRTIATSTINEACNRSNKNKSWLITFAAKIEEVLKKELGIITEPFPQSLYEKFKKNEDIKELQQERLNKGSAIHDVLAYMYIREKRGTAIQTFQKAKIWFLTSNKKLHTFNVSHTKMAGVSEITIPEALTSLLWLKNPSKNFDKIKSLGLSELMASTIVEEVASGDLINEFAEQVKRIDHFSEEDYGILLGSVAHESAKRIENFVQLAEKDPNKAQIEARKLVEKERSRRNKDNEKIKTAQRSEEQIKMETVALTEKFSALENNLREENRKLRNDNILLENQKRLPLRNRFIRNKMYIWRGKIIFCIVLCSSLLFLVLYYVYKTNGESMVQAYYQLKQSSENIFIAAAVFLLTAVFNGFLIKVLSDRFNASAVGAFKNSIAIPDDLKEIKNT